MATLNQINTIAKKRAIEALATSESGMTEQVLMTMAGIDRQGLSELVAARKIRTRLVTMAQPPGLTVTWYFKAGDAEGSKHPG